MYNTSTRLNLHVKSAKSLAKNATCRVAALASRNAHLTLSRPGMSETIRRNILLNQPPKIVFGENCALDCVGYVRERGLRRLLVVTSPSVLKLLHPFLDRLGKDV